MNRLAKLIENSKSIMDVYFFIFIFIFICWNFIYILANPLYIDSDLFV